TPSLTLNPQPGSRFRETASAGAAESIPPRQLSGTATTLNVVLAEPLSASRGDSLQLLDQSAGEGGPQDGAQLAAPGRQPGARAEPLEDRAARRVGPPPPVALDRPCQAHARGARQRLAVVLRGVLALGRAVAEMSRARVADEGDGLPARAERADPPF